MYSSIAFTRRGRALEPLDEKHVTSFDSISISIES